MAKITLAVKQARWAATARVNGISNALIAIQEAHAVGLGPALAVAMLQQESGGKNVWGHDPTIFIGGWDAKNKRYWNRWKRWHGYVNMAGYAVYKRQRRASGNRLMQGVGPMQLTWWSTQDAADALGGCWKPRYNIRQAFRTLAANIKEHGLEDGIRRYNGSGPAAEQYARSVLAKRAVWRKRFGIK